MQQQAAVTTGNIQFTGRLVFSDALRSSFVCGLAGALTSNPVDVVRTRMMNQRGAALYQGTLDCLLQVSEHNSVCLPFRCFKPLTVTKGWAIEDINEIRIIFSENLIQMVKLQKKCSELFHKF